LVKKHASRQHFALRYWRVIAVCGGERLEISGDNFIGVITCSLIPRAGAQDESGNISLGR